MILLPQPLRGEAQDTALIHDKTRAAAAQLPGHVLLAAGVVPGRRPGPLRHPRHRVHPARQAHAGSPTSIGRTSSWATMPNINPWIIDNLGESSAVRRRAYAVLIDHLVPPSVGAELSGGLRNLHNDIEKWEASKKGA